MRADFDLCRVGAVPVSDAGSLLARGDDRDAQESEHDEAHPLSGQQPRELPLEEVSELFRQGAAGEELQESREVYKAPIRRPSQLISLQ